MSGSISTATSSASGSIGTPIAMAIGPTETTKLSVPGSDTELSDTRNATSTPAASDGEFQAFLERLLEAATLRRPAVGLGEDLRIEAKEIVVAALVHEGKVVHLSAFTRVG